MSELQQKEKDSKDLYQLISENISDLIEILSEDLNIEYFNERAHSDLLDYSLNQALQRHFVRKTHRQNKHQFHLRVRFPSHTLNLLLHPR